jgi:hypothetical protein
MMEHCAAPCSTAGLGCASRAKLPEYYNTSYKTQTLFQKIANDFNV